MKPPPKQDANVWIEKLASIDKSMRDLLQSAARGQISRDEASKQALQLSEMKHNAARSIGKRRRVAVSQGACNSCEDGSVLPRSRTRSFQIRSPVTTFGS